MGRPRKIVVQKYLTDKETAELEGKWIDESFMKIPVINFNVDVYYKDDDGSEKLLLKYRKNSISNSLIRTGWNSYKDLAKPSRGRGASAGPIDQEGTYWKKRTIVNTNKWSTGYLTPEGNIMKNDLDKLTLEELQTILKEMNVKFKDDTLNDKTKLIPYKESILKLFTKCFGKNIDPLLFFWALSVLPSLTLKMHNFS